MYGFHRSEVSSHIYETCWLSYNLLISSLSSHVPLLLEGEAAAKAVVVIVLAVFPVPADGRVFPWGRGGRRSTTTTPVLVRPRRRGGVRGAAPLPALGLAVPAVVVPLLLVRVTKGAQLFSTTSNLWWPVSFVPDLEVAQAFNGERGGVAISPEHVGVKADCADSTWWRLQSGIPEALKKP